MKNNIKVIILDFGGTFFTAGTGIAIDKAANKLGLPKSKIELILRDKGDGALYRLGKIDAKTFWDRAKKKFDINSRQAKEIELIWHSSYKPNKGMMALVRKLKKKYKIVVVSGNAPERVRYLKKKYSLDKLFDNYFFSFQYGVTKPSPKLFEISLARLKVKPEECLIIDDSKKTMGRAKKLDCKMLLFKNAAQTTRDLTKLGIL
ncbi:MAG: HAD-IA family hydrolase [bacterium]